LSFFFARTFWRIFKHGLSLALTIAISWVATPSWAKSPKRRSKHSQSVSVQKKTRVRQAHELLGKHYKKSVVRVGEKIRDVRPDVREWTQENLPKKWKPKAHRVANAILRESQRHKFDPIFLMAVIQNESSFDPEARGDAGEIGLMQLRPDTAEWIAHKFKMRWNGEKDLLDPKTNIEIGASYLAYLRGRFDSHARLYISAYNMGAKNVNDHLDNHIWPKEYAVRVMNRYVGFYGDLKERMNGSLREPSRVLASSATGAEGRNVKR
jgi:soluble lytic murein transglycosylase